MVRARKPPCEECGRPFTARDGQPACFCARKRKDALERAQIAERHMGAIVRAVQAHDPGVSVTEVRALVEDVAPTGTMLATIAKHLAEKPTALICGGSRMPKVVAELIYRAIERGVTGLVAPSCAICDRPRTLFHTYEDGQRICTSCYGRGRKETCSVCGRENLSIAKRGPDGGSICGGCDLKSKPAGQCAGCGRAMAVRRTADGLEYCRRCQGRQAPKEACSACGRVTRVNARTDEGEALCGSCYTKLRPALGRCGDCGIVARLVARAGGRGGHDRDLCARCYRHPKRECGMCGRTRRVALRATESTPDVCPTCYWAPVIECSQCGQQALGRRTTRGGRPWCFPCQAVTRIDALLADHRGRVRQGYDEVRTALMEVDPRGLLSNWGRTESLTLLARLLKEHGYVTHDLLDLEGSRTGVHYLRALLVSAGVLEERDEHMARLRAFCASYVAEVEDVEMRHVLTRYAQWHIVSRKRVGRFGLTSAQHYNARQAIRTARGFLDHLSARGLSLTECTQGGVDKWAGGASALAFLRWLQDHNLLEAGLTVPECAPRSAKAIHDPETQVPTARRLLHDSESAGIEERIAGCLVLLYGQPLTKIVQLTVDDLLEHEGSLYLRLGAEPLEVAPPLAELLRQLPLRKPYGAARALADERWLFPSKNAGRHRHPTSLMKSLQAVGIPARISRNTAVYHLAGSVPPAVIASILGIHPNTAQLWAEQAGANWLTYGPTRESP